MKNTLTLGNLITFAKQNSRLDTSNYTPKSYKQDRYQITKTRKKCEKLYPKKVENLNVVIKYDEPLKTGEYYGGRLVVSKNKIEYIPGQYAPTEIYWELLDYLTKTKEF